MMAKPALPERVRSMEGLARIGAEVRAGALTSLPEETIMVPLWLE